MNGLEKLKIAVGALLGTELPTEEGIRRCVEEMRPAYPDVTDEEAEEAIRYFERVHGVMMTDGAALREVGFEPWLDSARLKLDPYYWDRYRKLLTEGGFSRHVLATMDRVTNQVLGFLQNPQKEGRWDRRGMVMGHVQSGKTANYAGLICKAADAGYKVIIVIAGIHNNLRNQTQRRIDEGFIGFDSTKRAGTLPHLNLIGVGRFDSQRTPNAFTTAQRDFNKEIADRISIPLENLVEPAIFVIKKNPNTLKNLIDWLTVHNAQRNTDSVREPMLLIDDEADNASINIRHRQDKVSRINGLIRKLLNLFERSCYIGYTATPFANIFIDPDSDDEMLGHDLFPRDFIVSLDPPSNYFGPIDVFTEKQEQIVRPVEDHADLLPLKHQIHHQVVGLPQTLETAVRVFIVARAIRLVRGQKEQHNSMLVNVSRFVAVQSQVCNEIHSFLDDIRSSVSVNGAKPPDEASTDPEIKALQQAFESHYAPYCEESWTDIQALLHDSVSPMKVIEVNSRSSDPLDYVGYEKTGLNVIAVGGFSLSRGLTLEGLVVSYFLRNSMMYDTLMQMGRWFGYRPGYEDLCRVWMPEDAQGWYTHIAESIEELRGELARMQSVSATPKEFGLRVRSHPDTLIVTARNKMGSGLPITIRIGLANRFVETAILRNDSPSLEANRKAAISLAERLRRAGLPPESAESPNGSRLVRGAPVEIVKKFLMAFRNHDNEAPLTQIEPICRYIDERQVDELDKWDIYFPGLTQSSTSTRSLRDSSLGFPLICQRRAAGSRSDKDTLMVTNKQRVSSRGIEKTAVDDEAIQRAEESFEEQYPGRNNYPDWIYRNVRTKPLLVVHLLAIGKREDDLSKDQPVVAWSISFPKTHREEAEETKVEYIVNTTWFHEHHEDDDDEEVEENEN